MNVQIIVFLYSMFAVIATVANLATQRLFLQFGETDIHFVSAIGTGTIVGLVVKYVLDKKWIFCDVGTGFKNHGRKFSLYTAMGVITTAIFWGSETAFWLIWKTDSMRELGAILGLTIGYVVKYKLDRRFVFSNQPLVDAK